MRLAALGMLWLVSAAVAAQPAPPSATPQPLVAERGVLSPAPSTEAVRGLADEAEAVGHLWQARAYLAWGFALSQTRSDSTDALYQYALVLWRAGEARAARELAERVVEIDPDHGRALILIGDYWASLAEVSPPASVAAASPVWVAVDYYQMAAERDGTVARQALSKAKVHRRYFPCRNECSTYIGIDGLIYTTPQGESTIMRFRDC